jgi:tRNA-2-methylthio-N6-dimethylallyladenosine synthase
VHEIRYDGAFTFKYSPRPNTAAISMPDAITEEEKSLRLSILMDRIREIQIENQKRHLGQVLEVMVEGKNVARQQWNGRTSSNKMLNFTAPPEIALEPGMYANIRVTHIHPNSLVGDWIETTYIPEPRATADAAAAQSLVQIAAPVAMAGGSGV